MQEMHITITHRLYVGGRVWFHPANGELPLLRRVDHIWPQVGDAAGVNFGGDTGEGPTSVPHRSAVPTASGFFWTFDGRDDS